jgi:chemotaxis protein MotB
MARKKKHPEHVNHERWLVSYADFITLLFAFFVVMFAVSQVDSKKLGRFTESFSKAVGIDLFPQSGMGLLPGGDIPLHGAEPEKTGATLPKELVDLKGEIIKLEKKGSLPPGGVQVVERRNDVVIRLSEKLLFDVGDDQLKGPAADAIHAIGAELKGRKVDVRVEGHTDDRPIHTPRFRSNWDLSTARATAVVQLLAADGLPPPRLSAAGYGEFRPVSGNDSDDGRKKNRRVDIVVGVEASQECGAP